MSVRDAIEYANSLLPGTPAPEGAHDPRWQAIIAVADYIESQPEEVWQFVVRWGGHRQGDLRSAIATCLLEHLLEAHFCLIFPRVCELVMKDGLFADTFSGCWKFGQSEMGRNSEQFDELQKWCRERGAV